MGWIVFTMNVILAGTIFAVALSAGVLVLLEIGRRIGVRQLAEEGETASKGLGAIEGAIFWLLGLILAFSFSGALTRFDARRHLVVEEANDIGTAWLRVALLPADAQPNMGARCLLFAGSGNGPGADAGPARAERNVRHHHDANRGR